VVVHQSPHSLKGFPVNYTIDRLIFGGEILALKSEQRRKLTRQEAGRIGGEKVARERGPEFFRQIGKKGGERVAEQRGSEFYREIGRKGGESRSSKSKLSITKGGSGRQARSQRSRRNKRAIENA
jgi:general stress protein YciG